MDLWERYIKSVEGYAAEPAMQARISNAELKELMQKANDAEARYVALHTAMAPLVLLWQEARIQAQQIGQNPKLNIPVNLLVAALVAASDTGVGDAFVMKLRMLTDALAHIALNSTDGEMRTVAASALQEYNVRLESVAVPQQSPLFAKPGNVV